MFSLLSEPNSLPNLRHVGRKGLFWVKPAAAQRAYCSKQITDMVEDQNQTQSENVWKEPQKLTYSSLLLKEGSFSSKPTHM